MKAALAALLATLALACDPPREPVTPTLGAPNPERQPLQAGTRPDVVRSFPIDYASLPFLLTAAVDPKDQSSLLKLIVDPGQSSPRALVLPGLIAEIESEGVRMFTPLSGGSAPEVQRLPNATTTAICHSPAGKKPIVGELPQTTSRFGGQPVPYATQPPSSNNAPRVVSWEGFRTASWTRHAIEYVRYEGTLDPLCQVSATRFAKVRAQAIVPGLLYGFRTCEKVCDAPNDDPNREELLVLIGPRASWVGSSAPSVALQTNPHVGSFSRIVVPLKRGSSASAFINVEEHELNRFLDAFNLKSGEKRKNLPVTQLAVDVSWLASDPAPLGVSFVSSVPRQGAHPGSASGTLQFEEAIYSFDK